MTHTAGIYLLAPEHADAIQRLASDPAIAEFTRVPHPYPEHGARDFIAHTLAQRERGEAYQFAIMDGGELVGVCGIHDLLAERGPEIGYWIGKPYWGKGYASVALRMLLEFAFRNLELPRVRAWAFTSNAASRRVLEKCGFVATGEGRTDDPMLQHRDEPLVAFELTRARWRATLDAPLLGRLHPSIRALLDAELAAGNEVVETGEGWPDADSVFVRVKHPFRARPAALPDGVTYSEPNDPHWWRADYGSRDPRHILAC